MERADEILANMGISDSVPLSEASTESLHSVGKKYNEDLPQIDDSQRLALLEACGVVDSDQTEIDDTNGNGSNSVTEAEEEVSIRFKPATRRLVKANPRAKPSKETPVVIVADHKVTLISKALQEMTGVGSIGVNMAGAQADPMKPKAKKKKKKSRKGNKATSKFLTNTFKAL